MSKKSKTLEIGATWQWVCGMGVDVCRGADQKPIVVATFAVEISRLGAEARALFLQAIDLEKYSFDETIKFRRLLLDIARDADKKLKTDEEIAQRFRDNGNGDVEIIRPDSKD